VVIGDPYKIEAVSSNHLPGKNNSDVKILQLSGNTITILPTNIGAFFPNLEVYQFNVTGVTKVVRENFVDLPNLRWIDLRDNRLQEVDNVFDNNTKLYSLNFGGNPLKHVSSRTFDKLDNLQRLMMGNDACINEYADRNRVGVLNIISHLAQKCPPSWRMIEDEFFKSDRLKMLIDNRIAAKMNFPVMREKEGVKEGEKEDQKKIKKLEGENEDLKAQLKELEELI
jgi:Leucine-rich repeat (LRR) protein